MPIVDCAVYEQGARRAGQLQLEHAGDACHHDGAFVWVGLIEPTAAEFDAVGREFDLHELAVEDAIDAHQRPKLERYGETLFVVLKTIRFRPEAYEVETGEILLFVGADFIVSVRHGQASALHDVREQLEAQPQLLARGTGAVLHAIIDRVVDDYEPVATVINSDLQDTESEVFSARRSNLAERIYRLERHVIDFQRSVAPLSAPVDRLARGRVELVDAELATYFRDVHDHLLRVTAQIESFRDLLASMLQANLTQVGVQQNEDVRMISAWVAILATPTMIAGIYGMNFEHMPELRSPVGYPLILVFMLSVCVYLFRRFRRAGWL